MLEIHQRVRAAMQFLIVDDDFGPRRGMVQTLGDFYPEATLHQAASVAGATAVLAEHRQMSLILLDLNVEDSRGIDTLHRMKHWCEANDCDPRIVVMSAAADYDESIVTEAIENCATGFIAKGSSEEVFRSAIEPTLAVDLLGALGLHPRALPAEPATAGRVERGAGVHAQGAPGRGAAHPGPDLQADRSEAVGTRQVDVRPHRPGSRSAHGLEASRRCRRGDRQPGGESRGADRLRRPATSLSPLKDAGVPRLATRRPTAKRVPGCDDLRIEAGDAHWCIHFR